jgi:shikimate kinase/3-dehydroquinate synthase
MVVVLVGFMGAGKTTVGHIVAERLGRPFVDSDVLIEQRLGRDIRDIFATEGEPRFRQLEHVTVAGLWWRVPGPAHLDLPAGARARRVHRSGSRTTGHPALRL